MVKCDGVGLHSFCVVCVQRQIVLDGNGRFMESGADGSEGATRCIMTRACQGVFPEGTQDRVRRIGSRRVAERIEVEKTVFATGVSGYWRCPQCVTLSAWDGADEVTQFRCGNEQCGRMSCILCQMETHDGMVCHPLDLPRVPRVLTANTPLPCPGCGLRVPRGSSGCNLVTCPCLQVAMCALCGVDVSGSGYHHFSPYVGDEEVVDGRYVDLCPLFERWASRRHWA